MTILSDKDIEKSMKNNELGIEPFNQKNLTPNGYDLSIDEIYIKKSDQHIKEGMAIIPSMTWFAISTKEFVKMGPQITSQLWIRSSYARKGIMASFGKVDAFENLSTKPSELYDKKSGNYQNQRGIKL
jgi:dCTP deaminase